MECVSDLFTMRRECVESYGITIKQRYDERKRSFVWPVGGCGTEPDICLAQQRRTLIDADWEFCREGQPVVNVNLPHDWSIQGVPSVDEPAGNDGGYYPTGKGELPIEIWCFGYLAVSLCRQFAVAIVKRHFGRIEVLCLSCR